MSELATYYLKRNIAQLLLDPESVVTNGCVWDNSGRAADLATSNNNSRTASRPFAWKEERREFAANWQRLWQLALPEWHQCPTHRILSVYMLSPWERDRRSCSIYDFLNAVASTHWQLLPTLPSSVNVSIGIRASVPIVGAASGMAGGQLPPPVPSVLPQRSPSCQDDDAVCRPLSLLLTFFEANRIFILNF